MSKVAVVTGAPGVGKSTVVAEALKELKAMGINYTSINYGDAMLELVRERLGVTDRDELRKIPIGPYREIQREAARRIAKAAEEGPVLVDTHCLIKKPEGYYPGLPAWVLEELGPGIIIIVEALPEEVASRRAKDISRQRDEDLLAEIAEHQQLNRAIATAYAALSGAAVKIVINRDGKLTEAAKEMVRALR